MCADCSVQAPAGRSLRAHSGKGSAVPAGVLIAVRAMEAIPDTISRDPWGRAGRGHDERYRCSQARRAGRHERVNGLAYRLGREARYRGDVVPAAVLCPAGAKAVGPKTKQPRKRRPELLRVVPPCRIVIRHAKAITVLADGRSRFGGAGFLLCTEVARMRSLGQIAR